MTLDEWIQKIYNEGGYDYAFTGWGLTVDHLNDERISEETKIKIKNAIDSITSGIKTLESIAEEYDVECD